MSKCGLFFINNNTSLISYINKVQVRTLKSTYRNKEEKIYWIKILQIIEDILERSNVS